MSKTQSAVAGAAAGSSVMPGWGTAIGGILGYMAGSDDPNAPENPFAGIPLPVLKELQPELYQQIVRENPQLESALSLGPSAMEGISTDPALRAAQLNALSRLQGISDAGGKDAQFQADATRLLTDVNANLRGNQGAIQQNLATRGLSGGMTELVSRQQAAQEAANRQSQMGLDLNAQAQQRALSALMGSAELGGQMEQRQFGQQSQIAQAKDLINKFNLQNRQDVGMRNISAQNEAAMRNAQLAQDIANRNVGARQHAREYNLNIPQQQFQNQIARAGGIAPSNQFNFGVEEKRRQRDMEMIGGALENIGKNWPKSKEEPKQTNWASIYDRERTV